MQLPFESMWEMAVPEILVCPVILSTAATTPTFPYVTNVAHRIAR